MLKRTKEPQYIKLLEDAEKYGFVHLGLATSFTFRNDPKRLLFLLSRYKFVYKMFSGYKKVLEIGCGDGFGSSFVADGVKELVAIDFDPIFIDNCKKLRTERNNIKFIVHNILCSPLNEKFEGIYSLDVLEHINKNDEDKFIKNIVLSLKENGTVIVGTPSLESQKYASKQSREGHVNCKSGEELKKFFLKFFDTVFIFSMNDEIVHTGFYPMAHYLLALAANPKKDLDLT